MKNHTLLNFLLFICALIAGYMVSTRFYQTKFDFLPGSLSIGLARDQATIETMDSGQRSILFVSATSLDSLTPKLESIWLATYLSPDTSIRLLPIFPTGRYSASSFDQQLTRSFDLDEQDDRLLLDQDFLDILSNHNYWWSGYIVFDEVALATVIDLLGGIEVNGKLLAGDQVVDLSRASIDPHVVNSSQITLLQSACHKLFMASSDIELAQLISDLSQHILTDLDATQLQTEMQSFYSSPREPMCRFPVQEISWIAP